MSGRVLYIFLDEAGNFDFSPSGTPYFILGSLTKERPFHAYRELADLKYDLIERGTDLEYFHAAEDKQEVRNEVYRIIAGKLDGCIIDATVVEKRKTGPSLHEPAKFYAKMLGYHLRYILERVDPISVAEVVVFTDRIPVVKKRNAIEKAVKITLSSMLPKGTTYRVLHHDSKSNFDLQIADYCTWALHRKWTRGDDRSWKMIAAAIRSEFEIFRIGTRQYH